MRRHQEASSARPTSDSDIKRGAGRRAPLAFLGALVLTITVCLGAASAIADTPPSVTIAAPTEVSYTSAQVSGTVDPEGGPSTTTWIFETSTDPSDPSKWEPQYSAYGEISGAEAEASDPVAVGGSVYLAQGTEYSVRLVAENEGSANRSVTGAPYPSFTTLAASPPAVTIAAPTGVAATTAHFSGTVNPEGTDPLNATYWHFECNPECPNLGGELMSPGTAPESVSSLAQGLEPNTAYEVSLIAFNQLGEQVEAGPKSFTTSTQAPFAATIGATVGAGGTSATVGGKVNPRNLATTYWFEYGTSDTYGQSVPASKDASVGAGGEAIAVSQELSGLSPETTYHLRVVAKNATGTTFGQDLTFTTTSAAGPPAESCPNQAFRVGPSASLPNCRAYEQVSPQDKYESNVENGTGVFTPGDENVTFGATGAFAGSPRGGLNYYFATRTQDGWQSKPLTPALPRALPQSPIPPSIAANADGSRTLIQTADGLVPDDTNYYNDVYLRNGDGSFDWISKPTVPFPPGLTGGTFYGSSSHTADLSHALFQDTKKRVPAAAALDENAYGLYDATNGGVKLVNVDSSGDVLNPYGAAVGSGSIGRQEHALSDNGERIFFTTPEGVVPAPPPFDVKRIYLRESDQTTTEISATQCDEPSCEGSDRDAIYQGAAADGSVAFFTSSAQLTDAATPGGGLYRYDVSSGDLALLTPDATDPGGAEVQGTVANSDDGTLVYFVAKGKLADGANAGSPSLYLFDATTDTTEFIATLGPDDSGLWQPYEQRTAEVTPSGNDLIFRTATPLAAGYDTAGHQEIYRYDAPRRELSCVSCAPVGTPAQGDIEYGQAGPQNSVSDDGSFVFFQTAAPLVSRDTNGKSDVYQWHNGTVSLISSGTSSGDSKFGGASASGRDVLFGTWERLAPSDNDQHIDLYDARINGGFASSVTPPPTPCSAEGCRGSATGPGAGTSPGTANFAGGDGHPSGRMAAVGVTAISKSQAKRWAKTGLLSLRVKVPAAGRVKATARARLGKKTVSVASAATSARKAGTVSLALRLSRSARSYLDRHGRLPVTITVTYSKSKAAKRLKVTLIAQQSKQAHRGQR